jgi:hypothetical protein
MRFLTVSALFIAAAALLAFTFSRNSKPAAAPKQPDGWNSTAIRGSFEGIQVKEVDPKHAALIFSYELENTTVTDYRFAANQKVSLIGRLKSEGSLKAEDSIRIDNSIFLPARNRARVTLELSYAFKWPTQMVPGGVGPITQEKFRSFVAGKVISLQGFMLFDEAAHYQIELPGGWQELQPVAAAGTD